MSPRPVHWSIWEVVQHDTSDPQDAAKFNSDFWAYVPLNPHSAHPRGFSPLFGQATHASWRPDYERGLHAVKYDYRVGKIGLDSAAGWLAVVNGRSDHCFITRFAYVPGAAYPDHSSVEFCKGRAEAVFKDSSGSVAGRTPLGNVEPATVFRLTQSMGVPDKSFRVSVVLLDEAGQNRGVLGQAILDLP